MFSLFFVFTLFGFCCLLAEGGFQRAEKAQLEWLTYAYPRVGYMIESHRAWLSFNSAIKLKDRGQTFCVISP
jgi:hypothetical protein